MFGVAFYSEGWTSLKKGGLGGFFFFFFVFRNLFSVLLCHLVACKWNIAFGRKISKNLSCFEICNLQKKSNI